MGAPITGVAFVNSVLFSAYGMGKSFLAETEDEELDLSKIAIGALLPYFYEL